MTTLDGLCARGQLVRFQPVLDVHEQPQRLIYMEPSAHDWCLSKAALGRPTPNPHSHAAVRALLTDFCAGKQILKSRHLGRLKPGREHVWAFKTVGVSKKVRIFGWFYKQNLFIAALCKYRDTVSKNFQLERAKVIRYRDNLDLNAPKVDVWHSYEELLRV